MYHKSHFDFIPPKDDVYYYNVSNWRWPFPQDCLVSHDLQISLSCLCVNRETATNHFKYRLRYITKKNLVKESDKSKEPRFGRRFAYEPGTKTLRKGGITDEGYDVWKSEFSNVDIRHGRNFSKPPILSCITSRVYPYFFKGVRISDSISGI